MLDAQDIRFTRNKQGDVVYAIVLGWPDGDIVIKSLGTASPVQPGKIHHVEMLGSEEAAVLRDVVEHVEETGLARAADDRQRIVGPRGKRGARQRDGSSDEDDETAQHGRGIWERPETLLRAPAAPRRDQREYVTAFAVNAQGCAATHEPPVSA